MEFSKTLPLRCTQCWELLKDEYNTEPVFFKLAAHAAVHAKQCEVKDVRLQMQRCFNISFQLATLLCNQERQKSGLLNLPSRPTKSYEELQTPKTESLAKPNPIIPDIIQDRAPQDEVPDPFESGQHAPEQHQDMRKTEKVYDKTVFSGKEFEKQSKSDPTVRVFFDGLVENASNNHGPLHSAEPHKPNPIERDISCGLKNLSSNQEIVQFTCVKTDSNKRCRNTGNENSDDLANLFIASPASNEDKVSDIHGDSTMETEDQGPNPIYDSPTQLYQANDEAKSLDLTSALPLDANGRPDTFFEGVFAENLHEKLVHKNGSRRGNWAYRHKPYKPPSTQKIPIETNREERKNSNSGSEQQVELISSKSESKQQENDNPDLSMLSCVEDASGDVIITMATDREKKDFGSILHPSLICQRQPVNPPSTILNSSMPNHEDDLKSLANEIKRIIKTDRMPKLPSSKTRRRKIKDILEPPVPIREIVAPMPKEENVYWEYLHHFCRTLPRYSSKAKCQYPGCGKEIANGGSKETVDVHLLQHMKKNIYLCVYCDKSYYNRMSAFLHMKTYHLGNAKFVFLQHFIDNHDLYQNELLELAETCFPIADDALPMRKGTVASNHWRRPPKINQELIRAKDIFWKREKTLSCQQKGCDWKIESIHFELIKIERHALFHANISGIWECSGCPGLHKVRGAHLANHHSNDPVRPVMVDVRSRFEEDIVRSFKECFF